MKQKDSLFRCLSSIGLCLIFVFSTATLSAVSNSNIKPEHYYPTSKQVATYLFDYLANNNEGSNLSGNVGATQQNGVLSVCGTITQNTTWDADTVKVNCDVTVSDDVTLTIAPGTVVEFQGHYKLKVFGTLLAQGTASDSIKFTVADTSGFYNNSHIGWKGIRFNNSPSSGGANGAMNDNDSTILEYCILEYGKASGSYSDAAGGAIFIDSFSKLQISNNTIRNNLAENRGGGIAVSHSSVVISNNTIRNNLSYYGGGIDLYYSSPAMSNNTICNNSANIDGGGLNLDDSSPAMSNNTICNNSANIDGGGLNLIDSSPAIRNNTVSNNSTNGNGGGLFLLESSPAISNTIIYGNTAAINSQVGLVFCNPSFEYCNVQGGANFGGSGTYNNNIDSDPLFVNPTSTAGVGAVPVSGEVNWSLQDNSPCINTGTPDTIGLGLPVIDLAGNPRIYDGRIDIGAYEQNGVLSVCGTITQNTTWDADTVKVNCDVTVSDDVTLTIAPGTVVEFQGHYKLKVFGTLLAQGTASDSIKFTVADTTGYYNNSHIGWQGIRFSNSSLFGGANGAMNDNDSTILEFCILEYGKASGSDPNFLGGAIFIDSFSKLKISNNTIRNNWAKSRGSGIAVFHSSVVISNNTIRNNRANFAGGGIYLFNSFATISNNTVSNNSANNGGGVYLYESSPAIRNNTVSNNSANSEGGGLYLDDSSPAIRNNTVSNNSANSEGGGLYLLESSPAISNTIIYGNTAATSPQVKLFSGSPSFEYCNVQGGANFGGTGSYSNNIDSDPLFVNPTTTAGVGAVPVSGEVDWSLQGNSPCINTGTPDTIGLGLPVIDLAGNPRIYDGRIDIGAYERNGVLSVCGTITQNTTWDADTVKVNCDVTVSDDVTLTIAPGTVVEFQGHYKLKVFGTLLAQGTASDSIKFTVADTTGFYNNSHIGWQGIRFNNSSLFGGANGAMNDNDSTILEFCILEYGRASDPLIDYAGGAIFIDSFNKLQISNNTIRNNWALDGGGIAVLHSSVVISNNTIRNNFSYCGGGIYLLGSSPTISNNTISNNTASGDGGGLFLISLSSPSISNNTISNNSANSEGGGLNLINSSSLISNTIIYGNTAAVYSQVHVVGGSPSFEYCNVQGGANFGGSGTYNNNIDSDPLFVNPTSTAGVGALTANGSPADWSLSPCSPCMNRGTPDTTGLNLGPTDLAGNPRVYNGTIDIGAYEYQGFGITITSGIVYVNANVVGGNNDGSSWIDAFTYLQDAFTLANSCSNVREIWVAAGVYYPDEGVGQTNNDPSATFNLVEGVKLYGGFSGTETLLAQRDWETNVCILSGDIDENDTNTDNNYIAETSTDIIAINSYHVLFADGSGATNITAACELNGFVVTAGKANEFNNANNSIGGGLFCNGNGVGNESSPNISNCSFWGNWAFVNGGAIYNNGYSGTSSPSISNCRFIGNTAEGLFGGFGGAIYNNGSYGTSNPSISNCTFSKNSTNLDGGAIFNFANYGTSSPTISSCVFWQNSASSHGGAIYSIGSYGISSPTINSCSFSGNSSISDGGAIYLDGYLGTINALLINCIFWNNTASTGNEIYNSMANPSYSYCIIAGSGGSSSWNTALGTDGGHNIGIEPLFVDAANGDLHLQQCSPAIDAGTNTGAPLTDLDGNVRPYNGGITDMGAYEYQGVFTLPTVTCPSSQHVCANAATIDLSALGATPGNGLFTWAGGSGNSFDPSLAGVNTHTINYSFTDSYGCTNDCDFTITVLPVPLASIQGDVALCQGEDLTLNGLYHKIHCTNDCGLPTTYCSVGSYMTFNQHFSKVELAGSVQESGNSPYTDYSTTLFTQVYVDSTYTLSVEITNPITQPHYNFVYIDWNRDGDFDDADESQSIGLGNGTSQLTASIVVPANAVFGNTLMRLKNTNINVNDPCGTYPLGETEDYKLEIIGQDPTFIDSYSWSGPQAWQSAMQNNTLANIDVNQAGLYTLTVSSGSGCESSTSANVVVSNPQAQFPADTIYTMDPETLALVPGNFDSYAWNNGISDPVLLVDDYGIYTVTVTQNNCTDIASISIFEIQEILLHQGWGMFSTYINTSDSVQKMVKDILPNVVILKDDLGHIYTELFGGIDNIGLHEVGKSYQYKLLSNDGLTVYGSAVEPENQIITLPAGFSSLGYLRKTEGSIAELLSPIVGSIAIVKDEMGKVFWPTLSINMIGDMMPGCGYQIKTTSQVSFSYPSNEVVFAKSNVVRTESSHFIAPGSTGVNMTLGILKDAWSTDIANGDEVGIFSSNGQLVGSGVYTNDNMAISLLGYNDLDDQNQGLKNGETYTIKLWNAQTETISTLEVSEWIEGDGTYTDNATAIVGKLAIATDYDLTLSTFPNPFAGYATIEFSIPQDGDIKIELLNSEGKVIEVVTKGNYSAGTHNLKLDGSTLGAGNYFVKFVSNGQTLTKTIQVLK